MMPEPIGERVASLESTVGDITNDMEDVKDDIRFIRDKIASLDGSKKMLWAMLTTSATVGGGIGWIIDRLINVINHP